MIMRLRENVTSNTSSTNTSWFSKKIENMLNTSQKLQFFDIVVFENHNTQAGP